MHVLYITKKYMLSRYGWSVPGGRRNMARRHKYGAVKTVLYGITFDSRREAERYAELLILEKAGRIKDLVLQPSFELQPGFINAKGKKVRPVIYKADFAYTEGDTHVVEDVKGMETDVFKLKRKMFDYKYGEKYDFRLVK